MRIALITEDLHRGGAERVVARLGAGLAQRGHRVFLHCLRDAGGPVSALRAAGVTVREARSRGRDPSLALRLACGLRRERIEIVHAHSCAAYAWALPAAALLGLPIIHVRHGALLGPPTKYVRAAGPLDRFAAALVVVSRSDLRRLPREHLRRKTVVIPNGNDLDPIAPCAARAELERICRRTLSGPVVLFVGTICREKNVVGLVQAFEFLRRVQPAATLVCIGGERGGDYAAQVRANVALRLLKPHVVFAGPQRDAWRLMAGADVLCLPSVTEAMPNVIVEAMSQRAAIVATRVGDVPTIAPHERCALLVPPGDPAALARALDAALRDRPAAMARAERALARYHEQYRLEPMVRAYERVYHDCLCRRAKDRAVRRDRGARRPRVVMAGPDAGQVGGMASVSDTLLSGPLGRRAELTRFAPSPAPLGRSTVPLARAVTSALRHARDLTRFITRIHRHRPDLVHVHTCSGFSYYRSLLDAAIARLLDRRVVLHIHGGQFERFCRRAGRVGRWLIRRGSEQTDAVIVLSNDWRERLQPFLGRARLVAIGNGVDLPPPASPQHTLPSGTTRSPAARPAAPPRSARNGRCRFVYLGALVRSKGIGELIDAAAMLRDRGVAFELHLAGERRAGEPDWLALVRARGLASHVQFAGVVTGLEKERLLRESDCLVLPSHAEGLPMAVLEAGAHGVAVVATAVGALPELLRPDAELWRADGDANLAPLVPPRDAAALAAALEHLARDPALRAAVGSRLRRRIERGYSAAVQAERIFVLYDAILREAAHRRATRSTRAERLVGRALYPLHERLRRRRTLREIADLSFIATCAPDDVRRIQAARLRRLLAFAGENVPFYRDWLASHGVDPAAADPFAALRNLPPLDKPTVRANAERLVCRTVPGGPQPCSSGGTTGDTLHFFIDRVRQAQDRAARLFMQARFGVAAGARRAYLWGSPVERRRGRIRQLRDRLLNEILLDAFEMGPDEMEAHLERLRRFRPRVLYGYPSAVARLAQHGSSRYGPRDFPWLQLVVLTGEEVTETQRALAESLFGCPIAAEYGSREVGLIAHECPAGRLHVLSPHLHVEVLADGQPAAPGQVGEIVVTTLNTRAQPFIRYRLGDAGRVPDAPCTCGLPLPALELAGGKITGFIALPGGRLCHGALSSHVLRDETGIVEFKTHQRRLDWIEVYLVVNEHFRPETITRVQEHYRRLFGEELRVDVHVVDRIPPDPSGKRRYVVSDVAPRYETLEVQSCE